MSVQNPHDHFFKDSFSRPEIVTEFIVWELPAEISQSLDLNTLQREESTFIDSDLHEHQSDMLFNVQTLSNNGLSRHLYIYFMFEHKSTEKNCSV